MNGERNLISLFTGAGGLDLGLEEAGFNTIVASEIEPQACETIRRNKVFCNLDGEDVEGFISESLKQRCFSRLSKEDEVNFFSRMRKHSSKEKYLQECEVVEGDIRKIPSEYFISLLSGRDLFCVAGGPPCQPFSKAGKQKSLDCEKNGDLFFEFVRVVRDTKPKWFLFENVKGITFTKTDVIYQHCASCSGYIIAPFHVRQNFKDFESDRTCLRCNDDNASWTVKNEAGGSLKIIINEFEKIGYKCFTKVLNAANFGAPQVRERLIIVGTITGKKFEWPEETHQKVNNGTCQQIDFLNNTLKPWVSMYDAIWPGTHSVYGKFDKEQARLWVKNVVRPHDEPVTWSLDRPSPTIGAHQGAKLAFVPNGVPEKQLYRQQWATKGRKQGDTSPVFVEHRYLTDEELLKLQTFPSWWYLHGTRMQRAFQIGNAVPPLLAKKIGEAIIKADECENEDITSF